MRLWMFELIFLKVLLQISIFLLQTVPKYYTNILYTVKNLVKMIFKPPSPKNSLFSCTAQPQVVPNLQWRHLWNLIDITLWNVDLLYIGPCNSCLQSKILPSCFHKRVCRPKCGFTFKNPQRPYGMLKMLLKPRYLLCVSTLLNPQKALSKLLFP